MRPPDKFLMMINSISSASAYFCFLRSWWAEDGLDAAVFWKDSYGAFQRVTRIRKNGRDEDKIIDEYYNILEISDFNEILSDFVALGVLNVPQQSDPIIYSQCDDWYGLKLNPGAEDKWLYIRGGKHAESGAILLLDKVFELAPQLIPSQD